MSKFIIEETSNGGCPTQHEIDAKDYVSALVEFLDEYKIRDMLTTYDQESDPNRSYISADGIPWKHFTISIGPVKTPK